MPRKKTEEVEELETEAVESEEEDIEEESTETEIEDEPVWKELGFSSEHDYLVARGDIIDEDEENEEEDTEEDAEEETEEEVEEVEEGNEEEQDSGDIPRSRLNKEIEKKKAALQRSEELAARVKELEEQLNSKVDEQEKEDVVTQLNNQLSDLEQKLAEAIIDQDTDEIVKINKQIRSIEKNILEEEISTITLERLSKAEAEKQLTKLAAEAEVKYPFLDPKHESYDEAIVTEVIDLRNAFIAGGKNVAVALAKALEYIVPKYTKEEVEVKEEKPSISERKKKAVNKITEMKQPPRVEKGNKNNSEDTAYDVFNMTEEEFNALPSKVRARLRGDFAA